MSSWPFGSNRAQHDGHARGFLSLARDYSELPMSTLEFPPFRDFVAVKPWIPSPNLSNRRALWQFGSRFAPPAPANAGRLFALFSLRSELSGGVSLPCRHQTGFLTQSHGAWKRRRRLSKGLRMWKAPSKVWLWNRLETQSQWPRASRWSHDRWNGGKWPMRDSTWHIHTLPQKPWWKWKFPPAVSMSIVVRCLACKSLLQGCRRWFPKWMSDVSWICVHKYWVVWRLNIWHPEFDGQSPCSLVFSRNGDLNWIIGWYTLVDKLSRSDDVAAEDVALRCPAVAFPWWPSSHVALCFGPETPNGSWWIWRSYQRILGIAAGDVELNGILSCKYIYICNYTFIIIYLFVYSYTIPMYTNIP